MQGICKAVGMVDLHLCEVRRNLSVPKGRQRSFPKRAINPATNCIAPSMAANRPNYHPELPAVGEGGAQADRIANTPVCAVEAWKLCGCRDKGDSTGRG